MRELTQTLADRSLPAAPEQSHHDRPQDGEPRHPDPVGVTMGVLAQLGIAGSVPRVLKAPSLPDQTQQGFWGPAQAGEKRCRRRTLRLPLLISVSVVTSTIEALPGPDVSRDRLQ